MADPADARPRVAAFACSAVAAGKRVGGGTGVLAVRESDQKRGKKYTGKYKNAKCTKEASAKEIEEGKTNKYEIEEWNEAGKSDVKEFKGKMGTDFIEIRKVGPFTCKTGTYTGEVTGPKTLGKISHRGRPCTGTSVIGPTTAR